MLKVKLCLSFLFLSIFLISSFYPPSTHSVVLPWLHSLNIRVFCLLSHRGALLQLRTSDMPFYVCFFSLFTFSPCLTHSEDIISCAAFIYTIYLQTRFCVDLKSCMGSVFPAFFTVLFCVCLGPVLLSAPGYSGEDREGEDAQERWEVVVLARQEQQQQTCKFC